MRIDRARCEDLKIALGFCITAGALDFITDFKSLNMLDWMIEVILQAQSTMSSDLRAIHALTCTRYDTRMLTYVADYLDQGGGSIHFS